MIRRLLFAALPFAVIVTVFAVALQHHLGEPERAVRAFQARLAGADSDVGGMPTDFISVIHAPCEKGGCFAYDVRIDAAGRIGFVGHDHSCVHSPAPSSIDSQFARALIDAAGGSGIFTMPEPAQRVARSGMSTTLVVRRGILGRRIVYGDELDAPLPAAIAQAVDSATNDAGWLEHLDPQGQLSCVRLRR